MSEEGKQVIEVEQPVKRKRGRPRKIKADIEVVRVDDPVDPVITETEVTPPAVKVQRTNERNTMKRKTKQKRSYAKRQTRQTTWQMIKNLLNKKVF